MKHKAEKCEYCGADLQAKTTRKKFCSSKCRVYANREGNHVVVSSPATRVIKQKPTSQLQNSPTGLKGIELAIWRAEQKSKQSL